MFDLSYMEQVYCIMEEAFPKEERRTYEDQKALFMRDDYHMIGYVVDGTVTSFLAYYEEDGYCFVEHLATRAMTRGSGEGKRLLEAFLQTHKENILFEVELPANEIAQRRIGFYKRLGCHIYPNVYYEQPPLQKGATWLQLYIMSTHVMDENDVREYAKRIHNDVYGIK